MPEPPVLVAPYDRLAFWLPLYGLPAVVLFALLLRGPARRIALAVLPAGVWWLMAWVGPAVRRDGLTGFFVALFFLAGYVAITTYYGALLLFAIRAWLRNNARRRQEAAAATPERRPA